MSEFIMKTTNINTLNSKKLKLTKEIPVILEIYKDEVIAKIRTAYISGFGDTEHEAIRDLKNQIEEVYFELVESNEPIGTVTEVWISKLRDCLVELG